MLIIQRHAFRKRVISSSMQHIKRSIGGVSGTSRPPSGPTGVHPAMVQRVNPFLAPLPAWLRDFQTFQPTSIISISAKVFNSHIRTDLIHRVVRWYRAGLRAGTASTKHRSDVRGSTRKIYQQKGTGRARAGSIRAPQRRGGARCFGPKPRDFSYPLALKVRASALRSAFSAKFKQGQLSFVTNESIALECHKTKSLLKSLRNIQTKKILLIDTIPPSRNLKLASRSLKSNLIFMTAKDSINAYHVLDNSLVLLTMRAKQYFEGYLE